MTHLLEGFKADKVEELIASLKAEGYRVKRDGKKRDDKFDLIASKGGRTIAYAVRTSGEIRDGADAVLGLHRRAREEGYDDFRLKVVSPPRQTTTRIEGLEDRLRAQLERHPPEKFGRIPGRKIIEAVHGTEVDSIALIDGGSRVTGSAILQVRVRDGQALGDGAEDFRAEFPFTFDLDLKPDLAVSEARIVVDTSEYFD